MSHAIARLDARRRRERGAVSFMMPSVIILGVLVAIPVIAAMTHQFVGFGIPLDMKVKAPTAILALAVAVILGIISGYLPAYRASRMNIVEGLRHIG